MSEFKTGKLISVSGRDNGRPGDIYLSSETIGNDGWTGAKEQLRVSKNDVFMVVGGVARDDSACDECHQGTSIPYEWKDPVVVKLGAKVENVTVQEDSEGKMSAYDQNGTLLPVFILEQTSRRIQTDNALKLCDAGVENRAVHQQHFAIPQELLQEVAAKLGR